MTVYAMSPLLSTNEAMVALLAGVALGLGMLLSVGPRTLLLIRLGATTRHCWWAAGGGFLSDIAIFLAATLMIGAALHAAPQAALMLQMLGIGFLLWCGFRALQGGGEHLLGGTAERAEPSVSASMMQMLSVTWLNPLVYLEVGLVAGSVSLEFEGSEKVAFAAGYLGGMAIKYCGWTMMGRQFRGWLGKVGRAGRFNTLSAMLLFAVAATMTWQGIATGLVSGRVSAGEISFDSVSGGAGR